MAFRSATDVVALLKVESTYATAPSMAAADAILLMNPQIRPIGEQLTRAIAKPFFGGDPFVLVGKRIELSAEVDLLGAATAGNASPYGGLYRICGHSETLDAGVSATYAPVSTGVASATVDFFWAGVRFRMTGVRGQMDLDFSIKNFAKGRVSLVGILSVPTDAEPPSGIDWSAFQTPQAIETPTWSVTVGAYNAHAVALTMTAGATVPLIETSESRQVVQTARNTTGQLTVVKDAALAAWNPWTIAESHGIVTVTCAVSGSAGRNVQVPLRCQLGFAETDTYEGVAALRIPLSVIPSGAGGDEYSLIFT